MDQKKLLGNFSSMKPRIRVFLDRIEFMNPGHLPKDLESIMKEDFSMPRNPTIARIFRAIKLSENAGSGFDKMFTGWKVHYGVEPIVSGGIDFYKIEFPLSQEETTQKTTQKTTQMIIELMKKNPEITREELSSEIGITPNGIKYHISNLSKEGKIKRVGGRKEGHWEVIEE